MARTSATVNNGNTPLSQGEIHNVPSATIFRLTRDAGVTSLHLSQAYAESERPLNYVIGAGVTGRSYASPVNGFLFQSPLSYYSTKGIWDLSPGFEGSAQLVMTRPIEPACLNCHASGLRATPGTVNGFQTPAFDEDGVSCERCHGPGETHLERMKTGIAKGGSGIVNPAKLPPAERDSVCAQCHLVSVIRIAKAADTTRYRPGAQLFASTSAFLWSSGDRQTSANSHFEQLVSSACWRGSAGKLWCGSCHSAHDAAAKAAGGLSYRDTCLACHTVNAPGCGAAASKRDAVNDNCVRCHMPARPIETVPHAAQVDHTISRVPRDPDGRDVPADASLVPFPGSGAGGRELGLAYASEALPRRNRTWASRALPLLQTAAEANPQDAAVSLQLGQLYDFLGQEEKACELFSQAVDLHAAGTAALVNLGGCQANRGDLVGAMESWTRALDRNPALEAAQINLAIAKYRTGQIESARESLRLALRYDPFSPRLRKALSEMPGK